MLRSAAAPNPERTSLMQQLATDFFTTIYPMDAGSSRRRQPSETQPEPLGLRLIKD
jgi:hypothetical protein